jgi:hypothetical protein
MGDLLGSLIWGAKSGQYCVIGGGSLQLGLTWHNRGILVCEKDARQVSACEEKREKILLRHGSASNL